LTINWLDTARGFDSLRVATVRCAVAASIAARDVRSRYSREVGVCGNFSVLVIFVGRSQLRETAPSEFRAKDCLQNESPALGSNTIDERG
jgi:hypothetical protein